MSEILSGILSAIYAVRDFFVNLVKTVQVQDIIDIAVVAYLVFKFIQLVRETRAGQLLKGIGILLLAWLLAWKFELRTITWLLSNVMQVGLIALVVVFQPELRRMLEHVGRVNFSKFNFLSSASAPDAAETVLRTATIDAIVDAAVSMGRQKTGALMVIERATKLGDIISTGTIINADASAELIGNIFFHNSPLHDGAMVVRGDRLYAAGCFLPLTENQELSRELGTRHRAAVGMSENSDAVVVVVSEETGTVSVAVSGVLSRAYNAATLRERLQKELLSESSEGAPERKTPFFWKGKKK